LADPVYIYIYIKLVIHELSLEQFATFEQCYPVSDLAGPLAIPYVGAPRDVRNYVNGILQVRGLRDGALQADLYACLRPQLAHRRLSFNLRQSTSESHDHV